MKNRGSSATMPVDAVAPADAGTRRAVLAAALLAGLAVALVASAAAPLAAQARDTLDRAARAAVRGVVYDSLGRRPLAGAMVQLVAGEGTREFFASGITDSAGAFVMDGVPDGRFVLGFLHPLVDSLGLQPPVVDVRVFEQRSVFVTLGIPSPSRVRTLRCGPPPRGRDPSDSGAAALGFVRDARTGEPVGGANVVAEWVEFEVRGAGVARRIAQREARSGDDGAYLLCDVPASGIVGLSARRASQETDRLELRPSGQAVLRRDLQLGPSAPLGGDAPNRRGDGSLRGVVVASENGRPVPNAEVRLVGAPPTRADSSGVFVLDALPIGSRMVEVRALGYVPERSAVDIVPGGEPVRLAITSLGSLLDTVRVTAARRDRMALSGFADRQKLGYGRFLTADDVARRRPTVFSDLLRNLQGIRLERNVEDGTTLIRMRGMREDLCSPSIFVDGAYMGEVDADAVDAWVPPEKIAGVELYVGTNVPAQFSAGMIGTGCGSIAVWTK